MKILFLSLLDFQSFEEHNLYCDLLRTMIKHGHDVYCISPVERRFHKSTSLTCNGHMLKLQIGNIQKTGIIEKGFSTLLIEFQFTKGIKHFFSDVKFDLVIYSTPPITFEKAISYVIKRDKAKTYLLLKDIFPQNAVDLGMMSKTGLKSFLYYYFRKKEMKLYRISDKIGCMSQANVNYLLDHNSFVTQDKVEVCPNSREINDDPSSSLLTHEEKSAIREKYGIPEDSVVFVYGGNLGRPQNIPFIIECLRNQASNGRCYYLIIGNGTDYDSLREHLDTFNLQNVSLYQSLPTEEYESLIRVCDVGLIFLDSRFTIPNFPSRVLSYMQAHLPILSCTDDITDLGKILEREECGWTCVSNDANNFAEAVERATIANRKKMGENSYRYFKDHFTSEHTYQIILKNYTD